METYSALIASSFTFFAAALVVFGVVQYSLAARVLARINRGPLPEALKEAGRRQRSDGTVCTGVGVAVLVLLRFV